MREAQTMWLMRVERPDVASTGGVMQQHAAFKETWPILAFTFSTV